MLPSKEDISKMHVDEIFQNPGAMFWDCNRDNINPYLDYEFVILRAFQELYPDAHQLKELDKVYPKELVLQVLKDKQDQISAYEIFEAISNHYSIDPNQFSKYKYLKHCV